MFTQNLFQLNELQMFGSEFESESESDTYFQIIE